MKNVIVTSAARDIFLAIVLFHCVAYLGVWVGAGGGRKHEEGVEVAVMERDFLF